MKHPPLWRALVRKTKKLTVSQVRLWTARAGVYTAPSFLIIGAQKAGTNAVYHHLSKHPDVVPSRTKEIHFFNNDKSYRRGLNWYHSWFPLPRQLGEGGVTFEATPSYIYYRKTPERIYGYNPHARMILLLRDPVERAYSAWNMFRYVHKSMSFPIHPRWSRKNPAHEGVRRLLNRAEYPSFEEAVREEINNSLSEDSPPEPSFVRRGLYAEQIEQYFKYFDREQIMIVDSRQLRQETNQMLADIATFVGLRPHDWSREALDRPQYVGVYKAPISQEARYYLARFYRPHNERLYELLSHDFGW